MPLEVVNGLTFHVQELGSGPPVVLIHGLLLGNLASWYLTVAPALARTHRVLLYDLRGHGLSQRTSDGYTLAAMAADLEGLCARFDSAPVALVGHSYGGLVALRFAIDHPERVARLALIDMPLPPSRAEEVARFVSQDPATMLESLPVRVRQALVRPGRRRSPLLETVAALVGETSLVRDVAAEPDVPDAMLSRVACPVLCVYGEESSCRPVADRLASLIPAARTAVIPGGHWLPFESPGPLTSCLAEFLGG
jgi:pimeloyl-ACP methyl ester carboxylesterase